jgi:SAM-dependent methyltransferase
VTAYSPEPDPPDTHNQAVERTRAAYDRLAPAYVARNTGPPPPGVAAFTDRFAASLPAGATVLDLGCGPAHQTAWLRERGLRAVGADLSAGMLAEARRFTGAPLIQLDMRVLPFGPASFAAVWCIASLLHLPKVEAPGVLAEMRRVLAPAGLLALAVQEGDGERWDAGYVDNAERFFARYSTPEMAALLARAGFVVDLAEREAAPSAGTPQQSRTWLRFLAHA